MKQLLFLLLFPCLAMAQYPGNGNQKITLGEQTSADGLVWRGVLNDTALITPSSDTSAYIILDTVNNRFYNYNRSTNVWSLAGGGVSVTSFSAGTTGLSPSTATTGAVTLGGTLSVANGGTNTSSYTAGSIVFAGTSGTSLTQDNINLFWNNSTKRLALGANTSNITSTNSVGIGDVQLQRTTYSAYQMIGFANNNDGGGYMTMYKARGQSYTNPTIPLSNDLIGAFIFGTFTNSINTNPWRTNASILAEVDGTIDTTSSPGRIVFETTPIGLRSSINRMVIKNNGNVGIGQTNPTAVLHLKAGTATAAPIRLTSSGSTLLSSLESGAIEFNGTNLLFTPSTTRHTVNHGLTGSATLNFPSTNTQLSADLTITVTGAADGDVVSLGVPNAAVNANTSYSAWVSAANTVTVRFNNYSSGTVDPASGLFKVFVTK